MIPEDIRTEILSRMHYAEKEHGVRILLAVESGSRVTAIFPLAWKSSAT